jgi:hypothetical protein
MAREYTEIKVKKKAEKRVDKTEDQEIAQVQAEARASEALTEVEMRSPDADKDTAYSKADKKSAASDVKRRLMM